MGFCMSFSDAFILDSLWGKPALTRRVLVFQVTEAEESTPHYSCMIAGNCVFAEKGKITWRCEADFIKLCLPLKWGGLGVFGLVVSLGFFCCSFSCFVGSPPCLPVRSKHNDNFYNGMSENRCVYCQENTHFHLKPYDRVYWKAHHCWTFWARDLVCISLIFLITRVFQSEQKWEFSVNRLGRGWEGLKLRISQRNPKICLFIPCI